MVSTLNLNDMDGVVRVVRHALIGTFAMETAGAVLMSVCLIPEFGFRRVPRSLLLLQRGL